MEDTKKRRKYVRLDLSDRNVELLLNAAGRALSEIYHGTYECRDMEGGGAGIRVAVESDAKEGKEIRKLIVDFEKQEFHFERFDNKKEDPWRRI